MMEEVLLCWRRVLWVEKIVELVKICAGIPAGYNELALIVFVVYGRYAN